MVWRPPNRTRRPGKATAYVWPAGVADFGPANEKMPNGRSASNLSAGIIGNCRSSPAAVSSGGSSMPRSVASSASRESDAIENDAKLTTFVSLAVAPNAEETATQKNAPKTNDVRNQVGFMPASRWSGILPEEPASRERERERSAAGEVKRCRRRRNSDAPRMALHQPDDRVAGGGK